MSEHERVAKCLNYKRNKRHGKQRPVYFGSVVSWIALILDLMFPRGRDVSKVLFSKTVRVRVRELENFNLYIFIPYLTCTCS